MSNEIEEILDTVAVGENDFDLPDRPEIPESEIDEDAQPEPLCDSNWDLAKQTRRLLPERSLRDLNMSQNRGANKELRKLLQEIEAAGGTVTYGRRGHWKVSLTAC